LSEWVALILLLIVIGTFYVDYNDVSVNRPVVTFRKEHLNNSDQPIGISMISYKPIGKDENNNE
jgi:hypothetical protein